MSDMQPPMPPMPQEKKDNKFQILAAAFFVLAIVVLVVIFSVPSSDTPETVDAPVPSPIVTEPPASTNKYDDYMDHVLNNSGKANSWSKSDIIEFGDLVCQALDEGNSVRAVVNLLNGYASTTSDVELFASVMTGAVIYICPEYKASMSAYLNN
jgi:hypothetical protein